jgi:hypothetical protein
MMLVEDIETMVKDAIQAAYQQADGEIDSEGLEEVVQQMAYIDFFSRLIASLKQEPGYDHLQKLPDLTLGF